MAPTTRWRMAATRPLMSRVGAKPRRKSDGPAICPASSPSGTPTPRKAMAGGNRKPTTASTAATAVDRRGSSSVRPSLAATTEVHVRPMMAPTGPATSRKARPPPTSSRMSPSAQDTIPAHIGSRR